MREEKMLLVISPNLIIGCNILILVTKIICKKKRDQTIVVLCCLKGIDELGEVSK